MIGEALLLALNLTAADAARLGSDSYDVRAAASTRLAACGDLVIPALLAAAGSRDLEAEQRARQLLGSVAPKYRRAAAAAAARWFVYWVPDDSVVPTTLPPSVAATLWGLSEEHRRELIEALALLPEWDGDWLVLQDEGETEADCFVRCINNMRAASRPSLKKG